MKKDDIGFLVRVIANSIDKDVNRELESFGITIRQGKFLGYLHDQKGREVTQKELQDFFEISHPTTVGIVKRLESKGLIRARLDENDHRSKIVELTAGEDWLHRKMTVLKGRIEDNLFRGFSDDERDALLELLGRVYVNCNNGLKK
jgi:MarR family transcriptional regulator, repressor for mepA